MKLVKKSKKFECQTSSVRILVWTSLNDRISVAAFFDFVKKSYCDAL